MVWIYVYHWRGGIGDLGKYKERCMIFIETAIWLIGIIIGYLIIGHGVMWLRSLLELREMKRRIK